MRNRRIYTDQALDSGDNIQLDAGPSRHLVSVLRLKAGSPLTLFNGLGGEFAATLLTASHKGCQVAVGEFADTETESPLNIHLGIGISRGERMDWVVQKATELGVQQITPLYTERTEVKLKGEREAKKLRHWQLVSISACEQSGRNRLPVISTPQTFAQWTTTVAGDRKFVLHHRASPLCAGNSAPPASAVLLVGPEGGLTEDEILSAEAADFQPLKLGPRVLRTETAPLAAISILQARWGDMA